eukprot:PRCOL_00003995-RA
MAAYGGARHRPSAADAAGEGPGHVSVRVDMLRDETDQHIDSLRARVGALKSLTHRIDEETQQQAALADRLQAAVEKTQAAMSRTMRRVDKAMASGGTNSIIIVMLFALALFLGIYLLSKLV